MRPSRPAPDHLAHRAFSRAEAIDAGITPRMLQHPRFVEVFPRVYRLDTTELDDAAQIAAARLSLPPGTRVSHLTRLRLAGLDYGELLPVHFTIQGELHLDTKDIFLHRTVRMPPCDREGVVLAAAFIGVASSERLIDLIKIGDWLLHRGLLDPAIVRHLALRDPWRPGSAAAVEVLDHLDGRSRSLKESELRALIVFSGLPAAEVNADIVENGDFLGCGDLVFRRWRLVVEYEGRQHAFDTQQFNRDIDRYGGFRRSDWGYFQATQEKLARPRSLILRIHAELVGRGFDGPAPSFGPVWDALFAVVERPTRIARGEVDLQRHSA